MMCMVQTGGRAEFVTAAWAEGGDVRTQTGVYDVRLGFDIPAAELEELAAALERPRDIFVPTAVLGGRASVWVHRLPSLGAVVIKEFRRGGMLSVLRRKHYLRMGATRPDREFDALRVARAAGISAPEAVATFVRGGRVYRGWLVTRLVEGRRLVVVGQEEPERLAELVDRVTWQVVLLIRHRIAHVDLHPGNVLIDERGVPCLVDFDRAVAFEGSRAELRTLYHTRWTRAVEKHGLPATMVTAFTRGLFDRPQCTLVCEEARCQACRSFTFWPSS